MGSFPSFSLLNCESIPDNSGLKASFGRNEPRMSRVWHSTNGHQQKEDRQMPRLQKPKQHDLPRGREEVKEMRRGAGCQHCGDPAEHGAPRWNPAACVQEDAGGRAESCDWLRGCEMAGQLPVGPGLAGLSGARQGEVLGSFSQLPCP